ncbi:hypothetical protein HAX54_017850 [Datura stramonium]|uniref:Uncharacterized protein n=1 Tax=Datura stramonium TaxID=4076 RepID=A0ABS8ULD2_DATST|nr:hypothetical protein [Datura stramonium]
MSEFLLNIRQIITDEIMARVTKLSISLPFYYLVTRLRKEAQVLILAGIDVEIVANKKHDFDKSKDETKNDLRVHKAVLQVFGPSGKRVRVAVEHTDASSAAIGSYLSFVVAPFPTFIPFISDAPMTMRGLHAQIDDMVAWVNESLKELTIPDLASLVPKVADQVSGAEISSESQTFITPSPAIEGAPDATMGVSVTASTSVDISRATTTN